MPNPSTTTRHRVLSCLCTAAGMVVILGVVYALCGYWPLGPNSVMTGDLNSQYIPFYAHFYEALHSGTGSLTYAGDMGLGGGSFALFAYYFASPFAWLYLLFAPEAYGWLCCVVWALKVLLAALTFVWYLERHWGACPLFVPLGWCYALMGYTVAYAQNVLWLDSVILLPPVAAGLDSLLAGKRGLGFALALAGAIFTNFYMGYMLCIFSVLYIPAQLAAHPLEEGRKVLPLLGRFAVSGITGAALAGAVLVPAVTEILTVKNTALDLTGGVQFSLPDLVQKFFTGNFVWADVQTGLPLLYCGMLGLAGLLLYLVSPRPGREKAAFLGLGALLVLSMWWRPADLVWHGFAAPNWFPYRESFLLVFWLLTLGAGALASRLTRRRVFLAGGLALVLAAVVFLTRAETYGRRRWALACVLLLAALGLVWLWSRSNGRGRQLAAGALAVLAAGELALNAVWALRQFEVYPLADYETFVSDGRTTVQAVEEDNPDNLRIEKTFFRTLNDPMLLGFEGLTHFSSVQDGTGTLLLMALGYCNYGASYGYLGGSTAAADSLLSIGYFLDRDGGRVPTHFTPSGLDTPWQVYENENALPRALWSPGSAADFTLAEDTDPFTAAETLFSALLGQPTSLFTRQEGGAGDRYTVTADKDGILYAVFTGTAADLPLTMDGTDKGTVFSLERSSGAVIDLGRVKAGQTVTLTLGAAADTALFAVLDEDALAAACESLKAAAPAVTSWRDGAVALQTDRTADGMILLTLPYDENWTAALDGRPVTVQAAGYLLGVEVPAGAHTLTLTYTQPGAKAGLALSALGLVLALGLAFRRRKPGLAANPS